MKLSPKLTTSFKDYDSYHRNKSNKYTHYLGIPLIVVSLFGLLAKLSLFSVDNFVVTGAAVLGAIALVWYLMLDLKIGLIFLPVLALAYWLGGQFSTSTLWIMFVAGWVLQFIGHSAYEKNRPAFFRNFQHLLIGPLWIFCDLAGLR